MMKYFCLLGILVILSSSCKKNEPFQGDNEIGTSIEEISIQSDIQYILLNAVAAFSQDFKDSTVVIKRDSANQGMQLIFSGLRDARSQMIKGKINIAYTKSYVDSGAALHISFSNLTVNGIEITDPSFLLLVNSGSTFSLKGELFLTTEQHKNVHISEIDARINMQGASTSALDDNVLYVSEGSMFKGTNSQGMDYTTMVKTELVFIPNCSAYSIVHSRFVKGEINYAPANKTLRSIVAGNGNCSDKTRITIGNFSTQIDL